MDALEKHMVSEIRLNTDHQSSGMKRRMNDYISCLLIMMFYLYSYLQLSRIVRMRLGNCCPCTKLQGSRILSTRHLL